MELTEQKVFKSNGERILEKMIRILNSQQHECDIYSYWGSDSWNDHWSGDSWR